MYPCWYNAAETHLFSGLANIPGDDYNISYLSSLLLMDIGLFPSFAMTNTATTHIHV